MVFTAIGLAVRVIFVRVRKHQKDKEKKRNTLENTPKKSITPPVWQLHGFGRVIPTQETKRKDVYS